MKVLGLHELKPEDELEFRFKATLSPEVALGEELAPFLQALEVWSGEWMPDIVEGKRQRKYSRPS